MARLDLAALFAGVALVACGAPEPAAVASQSQAVVGGVLEGRYPAVGYQLEGSAPGSLLGPYCGATLIAPDLAVTAGHCVSGTAPFHGVAIGPGAVRANARAVAHHPSYGQAGDRYQHDVAVLVLERPLSIPPATIGVATPGGSYRYIGYGRTTPGGYDVTSGYTNERKSTAMAVGNLDSFNLFTRGLGGGLCWGDSGGPLMDEDGGSTIYGVLADFSDVFTCAVGNEMVFTSLDAERPFIDAVSACRSRERVDGCVAGTLKGGLVDGGLACETFCAELGLGKGDCDGGYACEGLCAVPATCTREGAVVTAPAAKGCASAPWGPLLTAALALAGLRRRAS